MVIGIEDLLVGTAVQKFMNNFTKDGPRLSNADREPFLFILIPRNSRASSWAIITTRDSSESSPLVFRAYFLAVNDYPYRYYWFNFRPSNQFVIWPSVYRASVKSFDLTSLASRAHLLFQHLFSGRLFKIQADMRRW